MRGWGHQFTHIARRASVVRRRARSPLPPRDPGSIDSFWFGTGITPPGRIWGVGLLSIFWVALEACVEISGEKLDGFLRSLDSLLAFCSPICLC